jgi:hypothetical protein
MSRMSRSTVQRVTRVPSSLSWAQILSAPYTDKLFSHTRRISVRSSASRTRRVDGGRRLAAW